MYQAECLASWSVNQRGLVLTLPTLVPRGALPTSEHARTRLVSWHVALTVRGLRKAFPSLRHGAAATVAVEDVSLAVPDRDQLAKSEQAEDLLKRLGMSQG